MSKQTFQWIHLDYVNIMNGATPTTPFQLFYLPCALFVRSVYLFIYISIILCSLSAHIVSMSQANLFQYIHMWHRQFIMAYIHYTMAWQKNKKNWSISEFVAWKKKKNLSIFAFIVQSLFDSKSWLFIFLHCNFFVTSIMPKSLCFASTHL